jgi:endonuclease YncB( thermonuclease family)
VPAGFERVVRRLYPAVLLAAAVLAALPAAANAASADCVIGQIGPLCQVWTAKVLSVNDGDTLDVDVHGDGTRATRRIRMTGVQAMEQTVYSSRLRQGECHAVAATLRLEQLVRKGGGVVRLAAEDSESTSHRRLRRMVAVKIRGRWRDVGTRLLNEGLAIWWPTWSESAPNHLYSILSQRALAAQRGLFDPDGCGVGPSPASPLGVSVNWDADGNDHVNPSGEWVEVANHDPVNPVALGGWQVRDATLARYTFPAHATIPPGGTVTVNVGREGDSQTVFPWGRRGPAFENATHGENAMGDGAYLFDPLGNVRAAMIYPCRNACSDPLEGALAVSADPTGWRESVTVTNTTAGPVALDPYVLKARPYSYHFGPGSVLQPSESMRISVRGAPEDDTPLRKHWGLARRILRDDGGVVFLSTYTDIIVGCAAWGAEGC